MTPTDFGLGVLASWLANKLEVVLKPEGHPMPELHQSPQPQQLIEPQSRPARIRRFKTFDAHYDLPSFVKEVSQPVVSLLIERSPSSHYNLMCVVLESSATGEWFVFDRGSLAFQGTGGGYYNTSNIIQFLKGAAVPIGVWVYDNNYVDDLENGYLLWPEIRGKGILLRSLVTDESSWTTIANRAELMLRKSLNRPGFTGDSIS
ncbi:hypothetical protein [Vreelandella sulfidaeris]